jgi:hypothetical protein
MTWRLGGGTFVEPAARPYHRAMHLRRAALLMALVLGVAALVEALAPAPRDRGRGAGPPAAPQPRAGAPARTLQVRYPSPRRVPRFRVPAGAHVVVEVDTSVAGEASVPGLGLVQTAEPDTPARFDVLLSQVGAFGISFDPAAGGAATVGRLVVASRG